MPCFAGAAGCAHVVNKKLQPPFAPYRMSRVAPGLEIGALKPLVGRELPLAEAASAHRAILEPGALGKIVLKVD